MEPKIRRAALMVCIGLVVALVSLLIRHPLAFILFLAVGAVLVGIAIVYYLLALVRSTPEAEQIERAADVARDDRRAV